MFPPRSAVILPTQARYFVRHRQVTQVERYSRAQAGGSHVSEARHGAKPGWRDRPEGSHPEADGKLRAPPAKPAAWRTQAGFKPTHTATSFHDDDHLIDFAHRVCSVAVASRRHHGLPVPGAGRRPSTGARQAGSQPGARPEVGPLRLLAGTIRVKLAPAPGLCRWREAATQPDQVRGSFRGEESQVA